MLRISKKHGKNNSGIIKAIFIFVIVQKLWLPIKNKLKPGIKKILQRDNL